MYIKLALVIIIVILCLYFLKNDSWFMMAMLGFILLFCQRLEHNTCPTSNIRAVGGADKKTFILDLRDVDADAESFFKKRFVQHGWKPVSKGFSNFTWIYRKYYEKYVNYRHGFSLMRERSQANILDKMKLYNTLPLKIRKKYMTEQHYIPVDQSGNFKTNHGLRYKLPNFRDTSWMVKPVNSSRGIGISYAKNKKDALNIIRTVNLEKVLEENRKNYDWMVSKYIDDPLLYKNRKFHMRLYLVIDKIKTHGAFLYKSGNMFISNKKYDTSVTDSAVHNIHVASGAEIKQFPKYFPEKARLPKFWKDLKELFSSIKEHLKSEPYEESDFGFNIFGCDIMLTKDYVPKLLEINPQPRMKSLANKEASTKFIDTLFETTISRAYGLPPKFTPKKDYVKI